MPPKRANLLNYFSRIGSQSQKNSEEASSVNEKNAGGASLKSENAALLYSSGEAEASDGGEWLTAPTVTAAKRADKVLVNDKRTNRFKPKKAPLKKRIADQYESSEVESSLESFIDDDEDDEFVLDSSSKLKSKRLRNVPKRVTRARTFGRRASDLESSDEGGNGSNLSGSSDAYNSSASSGDSSDSSGSFSVESDSDDGKRTSRKRKSGAKESSGSDQGEVALPPAAKRLAPTPDAEMSAYERKRLDNIRANAALLASLGMGDLGRSLGQQAGFEPKKAAAPAPRRKPKPNVPVAPSRTYRLRTRGAASASTAAGNGSNSSSDEEDKSEAEVEEFDDSGVLRYAMQDAVVSDAGALLRDEGDGELSFVYSVGRVDDILGLEADSSLSDSDITHQLGRLTFSDPHLKRTYAMGFSNNGSLLAAAGADGRVAVFPCHNTEYSNDALTAPMLSQQQTNSVMECSVDPLISFKDGRGWVSGVKFFEPPALNDDKKRQNVFLLVSGNDGDIRLWDCSRRGRSSLAPQMLAACSDAHTSGIFSMDLSIAASIGHIATAGKDRAITVSKVDGAGSIRVESRTADSHAGVVKAVKWKPDSVDSLLSSGNDGLVRLWDLRDMSTSTDFDDGRNLAINHVAWHPTDSHVFLSAGFSNAVCIWDTRAPTKPLFELTSHTLVRERLKSIYTPNFVHLNRKTYVVTGGEGSKCLTVYDVARSSDDAATVPRVSSRGDLGFDVTNLEYCSESKRLALARGGSVMLLQPRFSVRPSPSSSGME